MLALGMIGGAIAQQQGSPPGAAMGPGMVMGMDPDDGGAMPMMMMRMRMREMMMGQGAMPMMGMGRHIEGRLAFLKTELQITPAQEPLWDVLAETLRANARQMAGMMPSGGTYRGGMMAQGEAPSLPERLDRQERFLTTRLEAVRAMKEAVTPLYAVFSDVQKRTADELVAGPMGMGTAM
jgi:hypothetical protein